METKALSLGNIILLKEKGGGIRESILRQIDKKSRGPQRESGLEFSRRIRDKRINFFCPSTFLRII